MTHRSYNFRIYPTASQQSLLTRHFGHNRFVWNRFLGIRKKFYEENKDADKKGLNYNDTAKQLTELKSSEGYEWLNEVNSQSLQQTLKQLDNSYKGFFKKTHKFPRFKKRGNKNSFTIPQHISIRENKLHIPKFKSGIEINLHREIEGEICYATISKTACGNYYCAITVEFQPVELPKTGSEVGIDLGIKNFAIISDGTKIENPRHFVSNQKKLAFYQRQLSKTINKASSAYKFRRLRVAQQHANISNKRKDFLHKTSYEIIKNHDVICMESLNVKGMIKNHKLAKHIADVGWSKFADFVKYKSIWYGKKLVEISQWFPSSQLCSECGYQNRTLTLNDREWVCVECGCVHDRDVNASINIKNQGLNILSGSWTDSDVKQKRLEPLSNVSLCNNNEIDKVLKVEASRSLA